MSAVAKMTVTTISLNIPVVQSEGATKVFEFPPIMLYFAISKDDVQRAYDEVFGSYTLQNPIPIKDVPQKFDTIVAKLKRYKPQAPAPAAHALSPAQAAAAADVHQRVASHMSDSSSDSDSADDAPVARAADRGEARSGDKANQKTDK